MRYYKWRLCSREAGEWNVVHDSGDRGFPTWHDAADDAERWIVDTAFRGLVGHLACAVICGDDVTHFRPYGGGEWSDRAAALEVARAQGRMFP